MEKIEKQTRRIRADMDRTGFHQATFRPSLFKPPFQAEARHAG